MDAVMRIEQPRACAPVDTRHDFTDALKSDCVCKVYEAEGDDVGLCGAHACGGRGTTCSTISDHPPAAAQGAEARKLAEKTVMEIMRSTDTHAAHVAGSAPLQCGGAGAVPRRGILRDRFRRGYYPAVNDGKMPS